MKNVCRLCHGVHNHLERNHHTCNKHKVNCGSNFIFHPHNKPCNHGTEYNNQDYGNHRDKEGVSDTVKKVDFRKSFCIVFKSSEAFRIGQFKRCCGNIQLVFQGVHQYQRDGNNENHRQNSKNNINGNV